MAILSCCSGPAPQAGQQPVNPGYFHGREVALIMGGLITVGLALYLLRARNQTSASSIRKEISVTADPMLIDRLEDQFMNHERIRSLLTDSGLIQDPRLCNAIKRLPEHQIIDFVDAVMSDINVHIKEGVVDAWKTAGPEALSWDGARWAKFFEEARVDASHPCHARMMWAERLDQSIKPAFMEQINQEWEAFVRPHVGEATVEPFFDMGTLSDDLLDGILPPPGTTWDQLEGMLEWSLEEAKDDLLYDLEWLRPEGRELYEWTHEYFTHL